MNIYIIHIYIYISQTQSHESYKLMNHGFTFQNSPNYMRSGIETHQLVSNCLQLNKFESPPDVTITLTYFHSRKTLSSFHKIKIYFIFYNKRSFLGYNKLKKLYERFHV